MPASPFRASQDFANRPETFDVRDSSIRLGAVSSILAPTGRAEQLFATIPFTLTRDAALTTLSVTPSDVGGENLVFGYSEPLGAPNVPATSVQFAPRTMVASPVSNQTLDLETGPRFTHAAPPGFARPIVSQSVPTTRRTDTAIRLLNDRFVSVERSEPSDPSPAPHWRPAPRRWLDILGDDVAEDLREDGGEEPDAIDEPFSAALDWKGDLLDDAVEGMVATLIDPPNSRFRLQFPTFGLPPPPDRVADPSNTDDATTRFDRDAGNDGLDRLRQAWFDITEVMSVTNEPFPGPSLEKPTSTTPSNHHDPQTNPDLSAAGEPLPASR